MNTDTNRHLDHAVKTVKSWRPFICVVFVYPLYRKRCLAFSDPVMCSNPLRFNRNTICREKQEISFFVLQLNFPGLGSYEGHTLLAGE